MLEAISEAALGAREQTLGTSVQGRPLVAYDIGQGEHTSVVLAGIHAMEWIGVEVCLGLMRKLIADPPRDRVVRVHPLVNPDGYVRVEEGLRTGRRHFDRTNANGVDLNRNWPTHWKASHRAGTLLPFLGNGGSAPQSEPEVAAVLRGLDGFSSVKRALSLHSFGRKVLYPYGGRWRRVADFEAHRDAAEEIATATGYDAVQTSRWVPGAFAHGMELDHLYDAYGALAILIECSGGFSSRTPSMWLHPFQWFNPADPAQVARGLEHPLERFLRG